MAFEQILSLLQHSSGRASRSTALQPLVWLTPITGLILLGALKYGAFVWVIVTLASFLGLVVAVFLGSYVYLLRSNPDALRSERFTLEKMALQQSRRGDDQVGFTQQTAQLSGSPKVSIGDEPVGVK